MNETRAREARCQSGLIDAAYAIAHIAGCDEPNSCAQLCDIADIAERPWDDRCECLNMARAAAQAIVQRAEPTVIAPKDQM